MTKIIISIPWKWFVDAGLGYIEGYIGSDITDEFMGPLGFLEAWVSAYDDGRGGWYYEATFVFEDHETARDWYESSEFSDCGDFETVSS
jgi:hypothetical protein